MRTYLVLFIGVCLVGAVSIKTTLLATTLEEVANLDTSKFTCATPANEFIQMEDSLSQWSDIVEHQDFIAEDMKTLKTMSKIIKTFQKSLHAKDSSFAQVNIKKQLEKELKALRLPQTKSKIGAAQVEEIEEEVKDIESKNTDKSDACCAALLKMIMQLLSQLENVKSQCQAQPVTVIRIQGKIKDLQVIQSGCGGGPQTVVVAEDDSDEPSEQEAQPEQPQEEGPEVETVEAEPQPAPEAPEEEGPEVETVEADPQPAPEVPEAPQVPEESGPEVQTVDAEEEAQPMVGGPDSLPPWLRPDYVAPAADVVQDENTVQDVPVQQSDAAPIDPEVYGDDPSSPPLPPAPQPTQEAPQDINVGGDPSTWSPSGNDEVPTIRVDPVAPPRYNPGPPRVGGDPSTWSPSGKDGDFILKVDPLTGSSARPPQRGPPSQPNPPAPVSGNKGPAPAPPRRAGGYPPVWTPTSGSGDLSKFTQPKAIPSPPIPQGEQIDLPAVIPDHQSSLPPPMVTHHPAQPHPSHVDGQPPKHHQVHHVNQEVPVDNQPAAQPQQAPAPISVGGDPSTWSPPGNEQSEEDFITRVDPAIHEGPEAPEYHPEEYDGDLITSFPDPTVEENPAAEPEYHPDQEEDQHPEPITAGDPVAPAPLDYEGEISSDPGLQKADEDYEQPIVEVDPVVVPPVDFDGEDVTAAPEVIVDEAAPEQHVEAQEEVPAPEVIVDEAAPEQHVEAQEEVPAPQPPTENLVPVEDGEEVAHVPAVSQECRQSSVGVIDVSVDQEEGAYGQVEKSLSLYYGFSFQFRWLTRYPTPMYHGKQGDKYFMASLSSSTTPHVLGLYLNKGTFHFSTVDKNTQNEDAFDNVGYIDIEGQWGYVYFGYDSVSKRAQGFLKMDGEEVRVVDIPAEHEPLDLVQLVVGGKGSLPSFQGQIAGVQLYTSQEELISSEDDFVNRVVACNPVPQVESNERNSVVVFESATFRGDQVLDNNFVTNNADEPEILNEYAVSGWFKWEQFANQNVWHTAFRVTINNEHINENTRLLGDRTLALFVGNEQTDNIYAFATYSYTDLNGNGNPNYWQAVPYEQDLTSWHYVYFGYSRHLRKAYAFVKFGSRAGELHFIDTNHFASSFFEVYIGQDRFYPAYNGQIRNFALNSGDGAFSQGPYDEGFGYVPAPHDEVPVVAEEEQDLPVVGDDEGVVGDDEYIEAEHPEEEILEVAEEADNGEEEEHPEVTDDSGFGDPINEGEGGDGDDEGPVGQPSRKCRPRVKKNADGEDEGEPEEEEEYDEEVPEPEVTVVPDVVQPPVKPKRKCKPRRPVAPPAPQPPAPISNGCNEIIQIDVDNAPDVLCAISNYLIQLSQGSDPSKNPEARKVCFCLKYDEGNTINIFIHQSKETATPDILMLAQMLNGHIVPQSHKAVVHQMIHQNAKAKVINIQQ